MLDLLYTKVYNIMVVKELQRTVRYYYVQCGQHSVE